MSTKTSLKPYSIQLIREGFKYNFHGFEKRYGRPNFIMGYACLNTNFYWRTYKHSNRAIEQALKVKRYYTSRKLTDITIVVYDNLKDKIVTEI